MNFKSIPVLSKDLQAGVTLPQTGLTFSLDEASYTCTVEGAMRFAKMTCCLYTALQVCGLGAQLAFGQQRSPAHRKPSAALPFVAPVAALEPTRPTAPLTPAQKPAHRAEIKFSQGQLAVTADNASLNQILREIGRQTGISISGGVAEERVFGNYGPSSASDLLARLLEGTGSNMLLVPAEDGSKGQLILTPRHGGVTPPNPNAPGFDDDSNGDADDVQQRFRPVNNGVSLFGQTPSTQGAQNPAGINPATGMPLGTDPTNPNNPANAQSPNGIKTPQEIMQQLQLLRQQQQQQEQQTPPE